MEKKKKKTKIRKSKWRVNKLKKGFVSRPVRKSGTRHDRKSQTQKNDKLTGKFHTYNPLVMSVKIVLIYFF